MPSSSFNKRLRLFDAWLNDLQTHVTIYLLYIHGYQQNLERKEESLSRPRGLLLSMLQISLCSVVLPKQHDLMDFLFSKLKKRGPRFFTSAELGDKKRRNPKKAQSIIFFLIIPCCRVVSLVCFLSTS